MKPPRARIGMLMLLVIIVALAAAQIIKKQDIMRQQGTSQAEIAGLQARLSAQLRETAEGVASAKRYAHKADQVAKELKDAKAELQRLKGQKADKSGTTTEGH